MSALRPLTDEERVKYADVIATQQKAYQDANAGNAWGVDISSGDSVTEVIKNPVQVVNQLQNIVPNLQNMTQEEKGVFGSVVALLGILGFLGWLMK